MCAFSCQHADSGFLRLHVDIDPEATLKATRACLQGQHAVDEAQGAQYDTRGLTQRCNSMDSVTIHQKRRDSIQYPNVQLPSPCKNADAGVRETVDSVKEDRRSELVEKHRNTTAPSYTPLPNADTNARGQGTAHGTDTGSHPQGSDNLAQNEGGGQASVSEEHDASTSGLIIGSDPTFTEAGRLPDTRKLDRRATVKDRNGDTLSGLHPYILHEPHKPVPIAIVNRSPTGGEHSFCY